METNINVIQILFSIASASIISAGGVGAIVWLVVKTTGDRIAERLSKKYEAKLAQELERYKTQLSKKEYVSKTRFDTEFCTYREINKRFFSMVKDISILVPNGLTWVPADKEDQYKVFIEHYNSARKSTVDAQDYLYSVAAFIPENIFSEYQHLWNLCRRQISTSEIIINSSSVLGVHSKKEFDTDDYKRTSEINDKWLDLNKTIREYLFSLEII